MEFMSRGGGAASVPPQPSSQGPARQTSHKKKFNIFSNGAVTLEVSVLFVLSLALIAICGWLAFTNVNKTNESDLVSKTKYQAVFLNGGATSGSVAYTTYFGRITTLNDKYVVLNNVYYLTTTGTDQNVQPQLTKLGCQQLHSPYDEMVINRNQVAFWENLQDNGKVVTAIKQFIKQNPNGPDCSASSTSTTGATSTQSSTSTTKP